MKSSHKHIDVMATNRLAERVHACTHARRLVPYEKEYQLVTQEVSAGQDEDNFELAFE